MSTSSGPKAVEYLPADVSEPAALVEQIRARRGGKLLNLDRMLLHSPEFARGWNGMFGVIRSETKMTVSRRYRELAICTIAVLNDAEYEFYQHEPDWRETGATDAQISAIRGVATATATKPFQHSAFSSTELMVVQLTVEMTRNICVSPDLKLALKQALAAEAQSRAEAPAIEAMSNGSGSGSGSGDIGSTALVELVGTIAGYNMVSRFLVALEITQDGEGV